MLQLEYDYQSSIRNSETVAWNISDVLPEDAALDDTRKFLPEVLVGSDELGFPGGAEKVAALKAYYA